MGQLLHSWDGRGSQQHIQYDTLLRPLAIFEHESNAPVSCTERYSYGSVDPVCIDHNQYGQLIRHDDPAGTKHFNEFGITGELIEQNQHFLQALESPNWPASESERDQLLETGAGYTTVSRCCPLGAVVLQTDAKGNQQQFDHTVDGQLREARLLLAGASTARVVVSSIHYNAGGQTQQQTAGNGVISSFDYSPQDDRLRRLRASRPQQEALQDFHLAAIDVQQGRGSVFNSHSLSFGARIARNDIATVLMASAAKPCSTVCILLMAVVT